MSKTMMWFRKDFRLEDNTAWNALLKQRTSDEQFFCVFQLNPVQFVEGSYNHGSFFSSLRTFCEQLKQQKIPLHFLYGDPEQSFRKLKIEFPEWTKVFINKDERGFGWQRDRQMEVFFEEQEIESHSFQDSHLHGVEEIKKPTGEIYQRFTPYYKNWLQHPKRPYETVAIPEIVFEKYESFLFREGERAYQTLLERIELPFTYVYGEAAATTYLKEFITEHLHDYQKKRDYPYLNQTSKLSRFLRTGELSIRKVWQALLAEPESDGRQAFISELCWRDFYNMVYFNHPEQSKEELNKKYRTLKWHQDSPAFAQWKNGLTGYPIVDAAMRQLNETGWMHNRLRMIVASFLTKDLLTDWRLGEQYFREKLIDYDSASNIGGWQWAASTGTDAVPYFRIFNPAIQSNKFDKQGKFIRRFVPELAKVPTKYIHVPQNMPRTLQESLQLIIGTDYPAPIVEHSELREKILSFYQEATN